MNIYIYVYICVCVCVYIYIYMYLNHFAMYQKLIQCCKPTIPQKFLLKNEKKRRMVLQHCDTFMTQMNGEIGLLNMKTPAKTCSESMESSS